MKSFKGFFFLDVCPYFFGKNIYNFSVTSIGFVQCEAMMGTEDMKLNNTQPLYEISRGEETFVLIEESECVMGKSEIVLFFQ